MTELNTRSSFAVQPERVLGQDQSSQHRVCYRSNPLVVRDSTRIYHDKHPLSVTQLSANLIRVCLGEPLIASVAVLPATIPDHPTDLPNRIEWSWLPDDQWQIAVHRHGQGLATSRGLYADSADGLYLYLALPDAWPVYGLGEKTGELNKQGKKWTFWNSDVFLPHSDATDELYQSIPFMTVSTDQGWMGIFLDNPGRSRFDLSLTDEVCISVDGGALDLYVFTGETIGELIDLYTQLTGRPFLPPKWALGYQQSRHSYESGQEVRNIVEGFRRHDLPLDALYLDILCMDGYRVFSLDPKAFAQTPELVDDLLAEGVRVIPIVDPGVKRDPHYRVYQQGMSADYFVQSAQGDPWQGRVWPGESVWPDFFQPRVQAWWQDLHRYYTDMGIQGFWNDMNEPAVFNDRMTLDADALHHIDGSAVAHESVHNAYGLLMCESTASAIVAQCAQRPFVLTRAGYAGIQRSAAVWTGDNRSSWEHLRMSVPMLLNMGLSGVAFTGADIGGFMDDSRPELFTRWMQLGCFYPLMRNHCAIGQARQEPWCFAEPWTARVRQAMHRRYKLLPYLYQLFRDAHETGLPILRPMFWLEEQVEQTENMSDQFMFGDALLIAPILVAGGVARSVWLPKGLWHSLAEDRSVLGGQFVLAQTGLEDIPIYLKAGAILPLAPYRHSTARAQKELRILIVDGAEHGRMLFRDDDGLTVNPAENRYARLSIGYHKSPAQVECHLSLDRSYYKPEWQLITLGVPQAWKGRPVLLNGEPINGRSKVDGLRCRLQYISPSAWL